MKKIKYVLPLAVTFLAAPLALTSISSPLKSPETSTEDYYETQIDNALNELLTGFKLVGTVTQARSVMGYDMHGNLVPAQSQSQSYRVEATYQEADRKATRLVHYGNLGGMESIIDDLLVFADDEGYCYQEYLDYKNTVQRKYLVEDRNKLSYGSAGLYNFAEIFDKNDFEYDKRFKRYEVDLGKTSIVAKNILGHQNVGFLYSPLKSNFIVSDGKADSWSISIEPFKRIEQNQNGGDELVQYTNTVTFKFNEIGEAKVPVVKAFDQKPENKELYDALQRVGDNMTLDVTTKISINDQAAAEKYRTFKMDGSQVLVQDYERLTDKDVLTKDNHFILKAVDASDTLFSFAIDKDTNEYKKMPVTAFAKNYQGIYYYEDLLPKGHEVSTDFFEYDPKVNEYVCTSSEILDEIVRMFSISKAPFISEDIDNASALGIRVGDDGNVDYVKYYTNFLDPFSGAKHTGTIKVDYNNIGSTTI